MCHVLIQVRQGRELCMELRLSDVLSEGFAINALEPTSVTSSFVRVSF